MSVDALLWIATLLFAATMLLLAARRQSESGEGEKRETSYNFGGDSCSAPSSGNSPIELGGGWTLGGDGGGD